MFYSMQRFQEALHFPFWAIWGSHLYDPLVKETGIFYRGVMIF